ncbi:PIN domain-containing protein [Salinirubellus sp. GCM10025818]|uniref:PIN domain-containing protein n=1 Tax=Salinirubellus TaxID=2162630 RepID=UPI0030D574CB
MTAAYVFDTRAIIAFLYDEPGHEYVGELLEAVDVGDYLVARFEGTTDERPTTASLRTADRDVRTLTRLGVSLERADWRLAGEVKAYGDISLADASAVALAHERGATLLAGGDDDFDTLPVDVDVERFRDHGV